MEQELRRNPDTGDIERKVVSYEKAERSDYEDALRSARNLLDEAVTSKTQAELQLSAANEAIAKAEAALGEAKSGLDAYQAIAGEPGVDAATEGVEREDEDGTEEEEAGEDDESDEAPESASVSVPVAVLAGSDDEDEDDEDNY